MNIRSNNARIMLPSLLALLGLFALANEAASTDFSPRAFQVGSDGLAVPRSESSWQEISPGDARSIIPRVQYVLPLDQSLSQQIQRLGGVEPEPTAETVTHSNPVRSPRADQQPSRGNPFRADDNRLPETPRPPATGIVAKDAVVHEEIRASASTPIPSITERTRQPGIPGVPTGQAERRYMVVESEVRDRQADCGYVVPKPGVTVGQVDPGARPANPEVQAAGYGYTIPKPDVQSESRPPILRTDYPAAMLEPGTGHEIDPINAVVQGDSGAFPPAVQLASQKIPADPPPESEVIRLPDPVPMNIEAGGIQQGAEPFPAQPIDFFARWMAGPRKVDATQDRGIGYERVATAAFCHRYHPAHDPMGVAD